VSLAEAEPTTSQEDPPAFESDEALRYVLGSFIRRLNCEECSSAIGSLQGWSDSTGFQSLMTFDMGHLYAPSQRLYLAFSPLVKPLQTFFREHLSLKKITAAAMEKFRVPQETIGCCSQRHADELLRFFCAASLRSLCKELNSSIKAASQKGKRKLNLV
jgi:hypothetical protein